MKGCVKRRIDTARARPARRAIYTVFRIHLYVLNLLSSKVALVLVIVCVMSRDLKYLYLFDASLNRVALASDGHGYGCGW